MLVNKQTKKTVDKRSNFCEGSKAKPKIAEVSEVRDSGKQKEQI